MKKTLFAKFQQRVGRAEVEVCIYQTGDRQQVAEVVCSECESTMTVAEGNLAFINPAGYLVLRPAINLSKVRRHCSKECKASYRRRTTQTDRVIEHAEVMAI